MIYILPNGDRQLWEQTAYLPPEIPDTPGPPDPPVSQQTYNYPFGLTFQYPGDWNVQETEFGTQLTPPDVDSNEFGPTELYAISFDDAEGITQADDPRFIADLDAAITEGTPWLVRTGDIENVNVGSNAGAILTWKAETRTAERCYAHVCSPLSSRTLPSPYSLRPNRHKSTPVTRYYAKYSLPSI